MLSFDAALLYQTDTIIVLLDFDTLERANSLESDSALELEGSDLENYLVDLAIYREIDRANGLLSPNSVSASSSSSSRDDDLDSSYMTSNNVL